MAEVFQQPARRHRAHALQYKTEPQLAADCLLHECLVGAEAYIAAQRIAALCLTIAYLSANASCRYRR